MTKVQASHRVVLFCWPLLLIWSATQAGAADDPLRDFVLQFDRVESIHLRATGTIALTGTRQPLEGSGQFEYWEAVDADGSRYRIASSTTGLPSLASDNEIAFNGNEFQYWDLKMDVLSLSIEAPSQVPAALPNPAFLPLEFLGLLDRQPVGMRTDLGELKELIGDYLDRSSRTSTADESGRVIVRGDDGGSWYRVGLRGEGALMVPETIEKIAATGSLEASVLISDYRADDSSGLVFPRRMVLRSFSSRGDQTMESELTIEELEVNSPIDGKTFDLVPGDLTSIWDSDKREYIRYIAH